MPESFTAIGGKHRSAGFASKLRLTRQSAISRLEADEVSPGIETLDLLLRAMGERLEIAGSQPEREYDPAHRRAAAERSPSERLAWHLLEPHGRAPLRGRTGSS